MWEAELFSTAGVLERICMPIIQTFFLLRSSPSMSTPFIGAGNSVKASDTQLNTDGSESVRVSLENARVTPIVYNYCCAFVPEEF